MIYIVFFLLFFSSVFAQQIDEINCRCLQNSYTFHNNTTMNGGNNVTMWYVWDFGDGTFDTTYHISQKPTHDYDTAGVYVATLTAYARHNNEDSVICSDVDTMIVPVEWVQLNCNDGKICTEDTCVVGTGCVFLPLDCDDGNPCTMDACYEPPAPLNIYFNNEKPLCDDKNACTIDKIVNNKCIHIPLDCSKSQPRLSGVVLYEDVVDRMRVNDNVCMINLPCRDSMGIPVCGHYSRCNDNDLCTQDVCVMTPDYQFHHCEFRKRDCNDKRDCTIDSCTETGCKHFVSKACHENEVKEIRIVYNPYIKGHTIISKMKVMQIACVDKSFNILPIRFVTKDSFIILSPYNGIFFIKINAGGYIRIFKSFKP